MIQYCVIKPVATCPLCSARIAVDAAAGDIIYTSLTELEVGEVMAESAGPCPHLACMWASVAAGWTKPDGSYSASAEHSREWIWEHGKGHCPADTGGNEQHMGLVYYLTDYFFRSLPAELRPPSEHFLEGASAMFRDGVLAGSGEFLLARDGDGLLHATLDGYAVFAKNPEAVMEEIAERSKGYEGRGPTTGEWPVVAGL